MNPDRPDLSACSEPLETEEGEQVVICQQNVGADNMVGGGEWKQGEVEKSPEEAAAEQAALDRGERRGTQVPPPAGRT